MCNNVDIRSVVFWRYLRSVPQAWQTRKMNTLHKWALLQKGRQSRLKVIRSSQSYMETSRAGRSGRAKIVPLLLQK